MSVAQTTDKERGEEPTVLNASLMAQQLGEDWQGLLLSCDPYCEVVALRSEKTWHPSFTDKKFRLNRLKAISEKDPLYPLLVASLPMGGLGGSETGTGKDEEALNRQRKKTVTPAFARTPYGLGWSLHLGKTYSLMETKSNTQIQAELAGKPSIGNALEAHLAIRPHRFFGWIQHRLDARYESSDLVNKDESKSTFTGQSVTYKVWWLTKTIKTGPRLTWATSSMKADANSMTHFSYDWTGYLIGWELVWRRFHADFDLATETSLRESQAFRSEPLKQNWYRLGLSYCSRDFLIFDVRMGACGSLDYSVDTQKAMLDRDLESQGSSDIDITRTQAGIFLRIGEDFYR